MNRRQSLVITAVFAGLAWTAPLYGTPAARAANPGPDSEQIDTRDALAAGSVPLAVPEEDRNRPNPHPASDESVKAGGALYSSQCLMCHGADGVGKGALAVRLRFTMPDFASASYQKGRTDGEIFYVLSVGHGHMKGNQERIGEDARWHLVNYVRSLGRRK